MQKEPVTARYLKMTKIPHFPKPGTPQGIVDGQHLTAEVKGKTVLRQFQVGNSRRYPEGECGKPTEGLAEDPLTLNTDSTE